MVVCVSEGIRDQEGVFICANTEQRGEARTVLDIRCWPAAANIWSDLVRGRLGVKKKPDP
ncbi:MAG: hypothetical protein ACLTLQ_08675 [[Clostridium] scindens]